MRLQDERPVYVTLPRRGLAVMYTFGWLLSVGTIWRSTVDLELATWVFWRDAALWLGAEAWGLFSGVAWFTGRRIYGALAYGTAAMLLCALNLVVGPLPDVPVRISMLLVSGACALAAVARLLERSAMGDWARQARAVAVGLLALATYDLLGVGVAAGVLTIAASALLVRSSMPFVRSNPLARSGLAIAGVAMLLAGVLASAAGGVLVAASAFTLGVFGIFHAWLRWPRPGVGTAGEVS